MTCPTRVMRNHDDNDFSPDVIEITYMENQQTTLCNFDLDITLRCNCMTFHDNSRNFKTWVVEMPLPHTHS